MIVNNARLGLGKGLLVFAYVLLFTTLLVMPLAIVRLHGITDWTADAYRLVYTMGFLSLVVFGTLGWLMWTGYVWTRWVSAFLMFVIGFLSLTFVADVKGDALLALLGKVVLDLITASFIAFSGPIGDYMMDKERTRKINL
jgi:hypothetical protein